MPDAPATPDAPAAPDAPMDRALRGAAVLEQGLVPDALVLIRDGEIRYAGPAAAAPGHTAREHLEHDGLILPGLVDLHDHGGGGESFPDCADADAARIAVREHLVHGTTRMVASLVTASPETLARQVAVLAQLARTGEIAGIHLEGPFISPARKGAQNPEHIRAADAELVTRLAQIAQGHLVTMTIAPEAEDADAAVEALIAAGAIPSFGHTDASAACTARALARARDALRSPGARSPLPTATHLFNGMRPIHHRDPGPAMACLAAAARGDLVVEVIGDGVHTAAETVAEVMEIAAPDHVALVTDAMAATGMPDGRYRLGALDVQVAGGTATLAEGGSIAGGTAHLLDVVRFCVEEAGVDLVRAVRAASLVPARVLGMSDRIGALAPGRRADVLLTDRRLHPVGVLRDGRDVTRSA